jgi:fatty acid-binding protein DegV
VNVNAIIALLELKGIITRDEGQKLVEYLNNRPQSTQLNDAVEQLKDFITPASPVFEKRASQRAKDEAAKLAAKVASEIAVVDEAMHRVVSAS